MDYLMLAGTDDAVDRILQGDEGLLLSEALAFRKGLTVGDSLALLTHAGLRPFPVFGLFRDYGSDRGVAVLARSVYGSHWDDEGVTSVGLHFRDGTGVEEALDRARQSLPPETALSLRSHTELRERTLEVFDRTFRITTVLQTLVFAVAFVGVLGALLALQLERGPELGVLRSLGVTPSQLGWLVLLQTGVMGAVSALLALPLGLGAAGLLVHVVNRRSFGWTVDMVFTPGVVGQALALAFLGSVLAALPAAWRTVSRAPSVVLRGE